MDGSSVRSLARDQKKSIGKTYELLRKEIFALPQNEEVTLQYCNPKRFGGFLVVDGKYVKVKGYDQKIPLLWGIDYQTHDIPVALLAPSESFIAWKQFFTKIKNVGYPLLAVIHDDRESIGMAAEYVFPKAISQLCHVHFLENIRKELKVRSDETYRNFVADIEEHIFDLDKLGRKRLEGRIRWREPRHRDDAVKLATLNYIFEHARELTGYVKAEAWFHKGCPKDTQLIECYNKHLEGRLKTIQGFESFETAKKWLNAYALYRRLKPFTDCTKKFRNLNGKSSLEQTRRGGLTLPKLFDFQPEDER